MIKKKIILYCNDKIHKNNNNSKLSLINQPITIKRFFCRYFVNNCEAFMYIIYNIMFSRKHLRYGYNIICVNFMKLLI